MRENAVRYLRKIVLRVIMLAIAALTGAMVAGVSTVVPLALLHGTGLIALDIEAHGAVVVVILAIGAVWGVAHMLDSIAKHAP
jgi:hypothetical protein